MRAIITSFNRSIGNCQARTDNDIAVAFSITDGTTFRLNEEVEIDLPNVVRLRSLTRLSDGKTVRIRLHEFDLHDLRLPSGHGTSRTPSPERLNGA